MISFKCLGCEHLYEVPDKYAGRRVRCKQCNALINIPCVLITNQEEQTIIKTKIAILVKVGIVILGIIILLGLGGYLYSIDNRSRQLYSTCIQLQQDAYNHLSNKNYLAAKEIYNEIINKTANKNEKDRLFSSLILDSRDSIEKIDAKIFSQNNLPNIMAIYNQGNELFETSNYIDATILYNKIIKYIDDNQIQDTEDFGWIWKFSKNRLLVIKNISYINTYTMDQLKDQPHEEVNTIFVDTIKYYASIPNPSQKIKDDLEKFRDKYNLIEMHHKAIEEENELRVQLIKEEKRKIELAGKHKDYPIEINCGNIDDYYNKMFKSVNSLRSSLDGNMYYKSILISSNHAVVKDVVLCEEDNATSWSFAITFEEYFRIVDSLEMVYSDKGNIYKLNCILHSKALNIGTTPDGYMDPKHENVMLVFYFHINPDEASILRKHIQNTQPIMITWMIDLNKSGKRDTIEKGYRNTTYNSMSYNADVVRYDLVLNTDPSVIKLYSSLKEIGEFNTNKTLEYLLKQSGNPGHDPKLQKLLAQRSEENRRQITLSSQMAKNAPRNIAEPSIKQLIENQTIKSATFEGYTNFRGDTITAGGGMSPGKEVFVKYAVEYVSKAGYVMQGTIGIRVYVDERFTWRCGTVYFNGKELWLQ